MLLACLLLIVAAILLFLVEFIPMNKWVRKIAWLVWLTVATILLCGIEIQVD